MWDVVKIVAQGVHVKIIFQINTARLCLISLKQIYSAWHTTNFFSKFLYLIINNKQCISKLQIFKLTNNNQILGNR